jgi:DNA-binding NtrC family response regulator
VASSEAATDLNIMVLRGSDVPDNTLLQMEQGNRVSITQAADSFAERMSPDVVSCLVVGSGWREVSQHLQQSVESTAGPFFALIPEGDVTLGHFLGRLGVPAVQPYPPAANHDWPSVFAAVVSQWAELVATTTSKEEPYPARSSKKRAGRKTVVFGDPASKAMLSLVERVAQVDVTALLSGPSGVGKEVVAQILHNASPRSAGPFIALNCSAMPEHLVESILFGHVKGSFTGAIKDQPGIFEDANQGTLFLDEVGELPLHVQPKLLRVIQERKAARIGSTREVSFDVRLVAATNRDLVDLVARGQFREDLLYRLNAFHIGIPRLRDRPGDIEQLAIAFAESDQVAGVAMKIREDAIQQLRLHDWPGNVRELDNVICRAKVLATEGVIGAEHIFLDALQIESRPQIKSELLSESSSAGHALSPDGVGAEQDLMSVKERAEWQLIRAALEDTSSKKEAAERLGISPRTLRHKLQKWKSSEEAYQTAGKP